MNSKSNLELYTEATGKSLYEVSLEIGLLESTMWKYRNGYRVSEKSLKKIKDFLTDILRLV